MTNLTDRELEIIRLVVRGMSNKDIANCMQISPHTAKFHVSNIARKLGVSRRTEVAVKAVQEGLV